MNICRKKNIIKKCIFEFLGTGVIIFFGLSCLAVSKLTNIKLNQLEISCIWGLSVAISIYFTSTTSGSHLNPAITIFFWLFSKFNKKKVLPYVISQILGSFCFTIIVYYFFSHTLNAFIKKHNIIIGTIESMDLAYIFCVYPNYHKSVIYDSIIEIISNILFIIILLELNKKKYIFFLKYKFMIPMLIGCVICIINLVINPFSNISLNPARDLGPKIFLSLMGWGTLSFTGGNNNILYSFIPNICPIVGVNLGGWIYKNIYNN
ncbi:MIP/aquaporin family protein [Buchnera aphidicola]|uniref:Glycerol uptake facilitator protein n=1 Tax=Buchnera aphidicola str. Ua (Uroleucon ambrosiae) TaxID=1005057 RepID=G2LPG6_BUCUM|nr:MIP/aquaporin family protein [Buchnera aphidicola]AEO08103.1 glycerol uptake facilitator protein [Buchnera aphidicola str. Ua (Uroleucon ambrosiae)]